MKEINQPLNIDIYFDYICPWCYIVSARLLRLKAKYEGAITINWKSFPLDPDNLGPKYTVSQINESRLKAGIEERNLHIEPWPEDKALPNSSMPAHEAAKCAQAQGKEAFEQYHMALMKTYFSHCRDISDRQVLISLAEEIRLDLNKFVSNLEGGSLQRKILLEHEEGAKSGHVIGVPTVIIGGRAVLEAAAPLEVYEQAVRQLT